MNLFKNIIQREDLELSKLTQEVANLQTAFESLKTENDSLKVQIKDLVESLSCKEDIIDTQTASAEVLEEVIATLQDSLDLKVEEVVALEEAVEEVIKETLTVDELASQKALEIIASSGVPVMEVNESPKTYDIMDAMKDLKGTELVDFWKKNRLDVLSNMKR